MFSVVLEPCLEVVLHVHVGMDAVVSFIRPCLLAVIKSISFTLPVVPYAL